MAISVISVIGRQVEDYSFGRRLKVEKCKGCGVPISDSTPAFLCLPCYREKYGDCERRGRLESQRLKSQIVSLYEEGKKQCVIAQELNISREYVRLVVTRLPGYRRDRGERAKLAAMFAEGKTNREIYPLTFYKPSTVRQYRAWWQNTAGGYLED
jgi:hypothetical protein